MISHCPAKEWIFPWNFTRQVSNLQATSAELPAGPSPRAPRAMQTGQRGMVNVGPRSPSGPAADPGAQRSPRAGTVFGESARNRMEKVPEIGWKSVNGLFLAVNL